MLIDGGPFIRLSKPSKREHHDLLVMSGTGRVSRDTAGTLLFAIPAPANWLAEPIKPLNKCHCHLVTSSQNG